MLRTKGVIQSLDDDDQLSFAIVPIQGSNEYLIYHAEYSEDELKSLFPGITLPQGKKERDNSSIMATTRAKKLNEEKTYFSFKLSHDQLYQAFLKADDEERERQALGEKRQKAEEQKKKTRDEIQEWLDDATKALNRLDETDKAIKELLTSNLTQLKEHLVNAYDSEIVNGDNLHSAAFYTRDYICNMIDLKHSNAYASLEEKEKQAKEYSQSYMKFINKDDTLWFRAGCAALGTLMGAVVGLILGSFVGLSILAYFSFLPPIIVPSVLIGGVLGLSHVAAPLKKWDDGIYNNFFNAERRKTINPATENMKNIADYGQQLFFKKAEKEEGVFSRIRNFVFSETSNGYSQVAL